MKELFVPYEIAKKLKEKGFINECLAYYNIDPQLPLSKRQVIISKPFKHKWCLSAPLYQQVIDWFREVHNIEIQTGIVIPQMRLRSPNTMQGKYNFYIYNSGWNPTIPCRGVFSDNYYEALQQIIEKALTLI